MLRRWRVPKTVQWIVKLFLVYLFIFTAFRIATVIFFKPKSIGILELIPSFWLGLKYDLRWITVALSPIIVLSIYKKFAPFHSDKNKKGWTIYLAVITLVIMFFFGADFGNFSYNHTRIGASALNFKDDPYEMFRMVWETYPIVWILIGVALAVFVVAKLFRRSHSAVNKNSKLQTVSIKLPAFNNILFSVTKRNDEKNNPVFTGYLFSNDFADGYRLIRKPDQTYQLIKIEMEKLLPTCNH